MSFKDEFPRGENIVSFSSSSHKFDIREYKKEKKPYNEKNSTSEICLNA